MRTSLGTLALLALVTGCSGSDPGPEATPPTGSGPSESSAAVVTQAEIDRAIKAIAKRGDGRFSVVADVGGPQPITNDGEFVLDRGYRSEVRATDPDTGEPIATAVVSTRQDSWFSIEMDGRRTCWMHGTMGDLREVANVQGGGNTLGIPPVMFVVSTLEVDPDGVVTSDLHSVLTMISGRLPIELGLAPSATDRVEVSLEIRDGEITTVGAQGPALVEAIDDAGLDLEPLGESAEQLSVTASVGRAAGDIVIEPPPAEFVVELSQDQEQFAADRKECDARYADAP
jgi:hypothetical protein